jgi:hypothetical protein
VTVEVSGSHATYVSTPGVVADLIIQAAQALNICRKQDGLKTGSALLDTPIPGGYVVETECSRSRSPFQSVRTLNSCRSMSPGDSPVDSSEAGRYVTAPRPLNASPSWTESLMPALPIGLVKP